MNLIHNGDCLEIMPQLPANSIDLILADLPYGVTRCAWDTVIPLAPLWDQYERLLKPNGACILTAVQPFGATLILHSLARRLKFRYEIICEKSIATGFLNANRKPLRAHENVLVFYQKQPVYNKQMEVGKKTRDKMIKSGKYEGYDSVERTPYIGSALRYPRSVIRFATDSAAFKSHRPYNHPTQKPRALFEYLICTFSNEGDLVLDNCIGSGTTAHAAINTNRRYIGIERDPKYFDIAQQRVADAQAQKDYHGATTPPPDGNYPPASDRPPTRPAALQTSLF